MANSKKQLMETVDIRLTITKEVYNRLYEIKQQDNKKTFQRQIRNAIAAQLKKEKQMGN